jgi:23S rRNA pseudouridine955/2504/2580 synthase
MKEFVVDYRNEGKKLFNFVKAVLPGLKNSEIFKLIRKKIIAVNDKKVNSDYLLKEKDRVILYIKNEHFEKKGKKNKFQAVKKNIDIVFEDDNILAINKPRGVLSQPDGKNFKNSIYEISRSYLYNKGQYDPLDAFTPSPCNRLDRNTSGIIIVAKNHNTLQEITRQLRERETVKKYIAIVYGRIKEQLLLISKINDKKEIVEVNEFKVLNEIPEKQKFLKQNPLISATLVIPIAFTKEASLIMIDLWTGKKHQIRAHMKAFEHPLLADKKYFLISSRKISKQYGINHYFLHSYKLKLKEYDEFTAKIPEDFRKVIFEMFNIDSIDF